MGSQGDVEELRKRVSELETELAKTTYRLKSAQALIKRLNDDRKSHEWGRQ